MIRYLAVFALCGAVAYMLLMPGGNESEQTIAAGPCNPEVQECL